MGNTDSILTPSIKLKAVLSLLGLVLMDLQYSKQYMSYKIKRTHVTVCYMKNTRHMKKSYYEVLMHWYEYELLVPSGRL